MIVNREPFLHDIHYDRDILKFMHSDSLKWPISECQIFILCLDLLHICYFIRNLNNPEIVYIEIGNEKWCLIQESWNACLRHFIPHFLSLYRLFLILGILTVFCLLVQVCNFGSSKFSNSKDRS